MAADNPAGRAFWKHSTGASMSSEGSNIAGRVPATRWSLLDTLDRLPMPATLKWLHGVFDVEVFRQAGISLSLFAPMLADFQTPHEQDEIYIVVSGRSELHLGDKVLMTERGDALFVAADTPHRFQRFSDDFACWVIFFPAAEAAHQSRNTT
ncbi:MAG: cupin domain-containing protein [Dokdonella sp.]